MYKALYRKYRPKNFNEVYGQDVVKKTIINEINNDMLSHAYLFCGPRGTGKTSVAKLVAKLVNCCNAHDGVACEECESCKEINNNSNLDIVEIDAASNNGVDEIRELRDKVKFLPTISKYKVYIIDEVHMLSTGAFNALLKTLEEPPKHVIFILATTEAHKIPITIISRCQRFDFKKISSAQIYERLKYISSLENIKITDDALKEISTLTDGGLRDAIGLLDKLVSYTDEEITDEIVHTVNYTVTSSDVLKVIEYLNNGDIKNYIEKISEFDEQGKDLVKLVDEIIIMLRNSLIEKDSVLSINNTEIIKYINFFNDLSIKIKGSNFPKILIETAIFSLNTNINIDKSSVDNFTKERANSKEKINNEIKNDEKVIEKKSIASENNKVDDIDNNKKIVKNNTVENSKKETNNIEKLDNTKVEDVIINNISELKNIRVSNAFARASKDKLNELKGKWNNIHEYSIDNVYGIAAGMLIDCELVLASSKNLIVTFPYQSMADRANDILPLIEYVLENSLKNKYKFYALSVEEWNNFKKEYIKNIKNGVQYKYVNEVVSYDKILSPDNSIVNESIELFGSDLLQIV